LNVDLTGFNPRGQAPLTEAKVAMHEASGSEADGLVRDMLRDPKAVLQLGGQAIDRELFTLSQLRDLLDDTKRIGTMQIQRSLRKAGAPKGMVTNIPGQGAKFLFAVANWPKWMTASHAERVANYTNEVVKNEKRRSKLQLLKPKLPVKSVAKLKKPRKPAKLKPPPMIGLTEAEVVVQHAIAKAIKRKVRKKI